MAGVRSLKNSWTGLSKWPWRTVAAGLVVGTSLALGIIGWWCNRGLSNAHRLLQRQRWSEARWELWRYLWLHPRQPSALLLLADSYIRDESIPQQEAAVRALDTLQQIPDQSTYAAEARTKEGWIQLFMLHQPSRAEEKLRHAAELDRFAVEPRYWLWKLYDLTGRSNLAEPVVWQVLELTPEADRAMRLREWYMSQFFPLSGCAALDFRMGLLGENEIPTVDVERRRFQLFRDAEPDRALGYAALARWLTREGMPQVALEVLQAGEKQLLDTEKSHPFFLATMIEVLIDLGKFAEAEAYFLRWPDEDRSFEYWRWRGVIEEEVRGDYQAAVAAYDQALPVWPGPVDWRMRVRKANCLARLGRAEEAERVRREAKQIEAQMDNSVHAPLRAALADLNDRRSLLRMAEFYRDLGRPREAASWLQLAMKLPAATPSTAQDRPLSQTTNQEPNGARETDRGPSGLPLPTERAP
ncbi:MAG: hypothetical protein KatS3mg110_4659 [Pirellulaceae bacterium]|nr:MAG: hypothetical protein KatS3mg110_4659 [Pirellulaceae bacterium]